MATDGRAVIESLDSVSFSVISHACRGDKSVFPIHLRKLLHDSPFAQAKSQNANDAFNAYQVVMTACRCIARTLDNGGFRSDSSHEFIKLSVSPDYSTLFQMDSNDYGYRVTLWSLMGRQKEFIGHFDNVINAQYVRDGGLAIRFRDRSLRLWTAPYDFGPLDGMSHISRRSCTNSRRLGLMSEISLSQDYLFQRDDTGCSLIRHENLSEKEQIPLPASLQKGRNLAFSPDGRTSLWVNDKDEILFWALQQGSTPVILHHGQGCRYGIHTTLFSPDSQNIIATSSLLYPFCIALWNCSRPADPPSLLEADSLPSMNEPDFYQLAFSADSKHLILVVDIGSGHSSVLIVIRICEAKMSLLCMQDIGRVYGPLCTFLNRWVFVGPKCMDMGEVFKCGL